MRRMLGPGGLALATALVLVGLSAHDGPAQGQEGDFEARAHLPLVLNSHSGAFPTVRPTEATPGATYTGRPSRTPRTTATSATAGPSPTATLRGEDLEYPTGSTIVIQIGWTWKDQVAPVWQEMEGTPWFTVYGDGRLIAGHKLFDRSQRLFEGRVDDHQIQLWLRALGYEVGIFSLDEAYDHPQSTKPSVHVYVRLSDGFKRVTVRGWDAWVAGAPPSVPDSYSVKRLTEFVLGLEEQMAATLTEPYQADWYTICAQQTRPEPLLPTAPQWPNQRVSIEAIADSAPLAKPSKIDRLVGHMFVGPELGRELWNVIAPEADAYFPFLYRAMQFYSQDRPIAVGARQEVFGGSPFLPDWISEGWYRQDIRPPEPLPWTATPTVPPSRTPVPTHTAGLAVETALPGR